MNFDCPKLSWINKRFFIVNAIKFWRSLTDETKNSTALSELRFKIKAKFLKLENDSSQTESNNNSINVEYTNDSSLQVAILSNLSQDYDPNRRLRKETALPNTYNLPYNLLIYIVESVKL